MLITAIMMQIIFGPCVPSLPLSLTCRFDYCEALTLYDSEIFLPRFLVPSSTVPLESPSLDKLLA